MSWDDDTKTTESSLFPPLVFSVSLAGFKEIDNTHHNSLEGLSCIQIVGSTTAYSVASLKLKISSVHLIKFTEAAAQKKKKKKHHGDGTAQITFAWARKSRIEWMCGQYAEMCVT